MNIIEELAYIDAHFASISPDQLLLDLIDCGLGTVSSYESEGYFLTLPETLYSQETCFEPPRPMMDEYVLDDDTSLEAA